ncbi:MAG TPA: LuxR C-terminal-related transcriptional regulator, partial [Acidimicrobiales bacterium]|nr:LuxR C-terminal-related transcriptional regulator [Acidimicrobiales bacterium]
VLANMWLARGRPGEAQHLLERAIQAATSRTTAPLPTLGDLHVGLADVLREKGDLAGAADQLQVARQLGDHASLPENRHRWFTTMAALLHAQGDLEGAVAMLDEAEPLFLPGYFPDVRPIGSLRARLRIAQGRLDDARSWARARRITPVDPPTYLAEHEQLTLARLLVAEGDAARGIELLDHVLDAALAVGRTASVVEARAVRALAYARLGDEHAAIADLTAALADGAPAGHRRLFLDEGAPMIAVLETIAAAAKPDAHAHATQVLSIAPPSAEKPTPPPVRGEVALVDPLSERELEVLRLLATDLSGPEIAGHLFVSINTLRTHTKHIFTKLDVNTRRAAVRRATELGLG